MNPQMRRALRSAVQATQDFAPFKQRKNPMVAALFGFFLGGLGLAIYFRSLKDLVLPVLVWFGATLFAPPSIGTSWLAAAIFCAMWGYRRASASNKKLGFDGTGTGASGPPPYRGPLPPVIETYLAEHPEMRAMQGQLPGPKPPPLPTVTVLPYVPTVADRLRTLQQLLASGAISEHELQERRKAILGEV